MEKNSYPSLKQENSKTVCERLIRVIHTTSPFRAFRFASELVHEGGAANTTPATSPNVSLMTRTPANDHCTRISKQPSKRDFGPATSPNVSLMHPMTDRCPRVIKQSVGRGAEINKKESDQAVPVIFRQSGNHSNGSARTTITPANMPKATAPGGTAQPKAAVLPIHGLENRVPTMSHVDEKSSIAQSINGMFTEYIDRAGRKIRSPTIVGDPSMKHDSFNDKFSDFINRGIHKFHNTPSLLDPSFKDKRIK